MDDVAKLSGIKPIEQHVRLFLGVTTLADISSSDGKTLCEWALSVDKNPRKPVFRFPQQERPTASYVLATWHRIIRLCYAPVETKVLERPMGKWYKGCINQVWDTVVDPNTSIVYMWINGHVRMYRRRRRHRLQYRFVQVLHHSTFPRGCVPISGQLQCAIFHADGYAKMTPMPRAIIPVHVSEMKNMNRNVKRNEKPETIARAIWEGKAIMGTDGSVRDPTANYSFVISISRTDVKTNVRGGGFIPPTA
jgi:hypothetical protein